MRAWFATCCLLAVCLAGYGSTTCGRAFADAPTGNARRVDGVAALVGGRAAGGNVHVVLQSDVDLRARMSLSGQRGGPLPLGPLPEGLLGATLQQIIGEVLIAREAERVRAAPPGRSEVDRELQRLEQGAGGAARLAALLEALSVPMAEVEEIARRRARVAAFLEANLEGTTTVTEAEVVRLYEAEREAGRVGEDEDPDRVRARLRQRLMRGAMDGAIFRWVAALRARTVVRWTAPYPEPKETDS